MISADGLQALARAHVCVIGIGGVGSWTVEALARSGVGQLTLIDLDDVCVSNINRQIHATDETVGKPKISVMADRARSINPAIVVNEQPVFYTQNNADELLPPEFDLVVDAIDRGRLKAHLIGSCRERKLPVVTCGGVGGLRDATRIRVGDLGRATGDPLLAKMRRELRSHHGFPKYANKKFHVPCVYSEEPPCFPWSDGRVCAQPEKGSDMALNCEAGFGTAAWVTGTMGLVSAQVAVGMLVDQAPKSSA